MYSPYIIDGIQMDSTPARMLEGCMTEKPPEGEACDTAYDSIVDETVDHTPKKTSYDTGKIQEYAELILKADGRTKPDAAAFPGSYTRRRIAEAIISSLWKKGHFTLEDIEINAGWKWDCAPLGNMAAFYFSAEAASNYLFDLGIRLKSYTFEKTRESSDVGFSVCIDSSNDRREDSEYDFFGEDQTRELRYYWISDEAKCPATIADDPSSWLIYIPFDTCQFRLGNSMLEKVAGISGDTAPEICDPDYFIDCFEVVRELVEDGVIIAGTTVGSGGLATAVASMCGGRGMNIDISGIERAAEENDIIRILFSEIPGILIQIDDADYDYIDAQLLLQDIAYFPVGHPGTGSSGLSVAHGKKPVVSDILASLIQGHYSEGED